MTTDLEFVNDWSELEAAVADLKSHIGCAEEDCLIDRDSLRTVSEYVPRLLTQYASLLETSFALTEGWEQYAALNPPQGLYLPDHR